MSVQTLIPKSNLATSILGWVAIIAGAIMANPSSLSFLPDNIEQAIHGISTLITFIAGGTFVASVKNKEVTGGSVPANQEAVNRLLAHFEEEECNTETELDLEKK